MKFKSGFIRGFFLLLLIAVSVLVAGCGASVSPLRWQDDALARFNTIIAADAETVAPEETDTIRQTLALADRYFNSSMFEDADRLYELSSQKSKLLYRNLLADKIRGGAMIAVEDAVGKQDDSLVVASPLISLKQLVQKNETDAYDNEKAPVASEALSRITGSSGKTAADEFPVYTAKTVKKSSGGKMAGSSSKGVTLYLTFDDGPSGLTLPIASYLSSLGVKATFFALGSNIRGREKTLSKVIAMGHRVGSHTMSHNLRKLNDSFNESENEVRKTAAMIDRLGGDGRLVRIPYGASTKKLLANMAAEGAQIVEWDIDSNDSTRAGVKNQRLIERTIMKHLKNNQKRHLVLLFHDGAGHDSTLAAIKNLVPRLKQEGYGFGLLARNETVAASSFSRKRGMQ